jgi:hypothetical protein
VESAENKNIARQIKSSVDWNAVTKVFESIPRESLMEAIASVVLQTKSKIRGSILEKYVDKNARNSYIKTTMIEMMSTPEYQLC